MHDQFFSKVEGLNLLSMRFAYSSGAVLLRKTVYNAEVSPEVSMHCMNFWWHMLMRAWPRSCDVVGRTTCA